MKYKPVYTIKYYNGVPIVEYNPYKSSVAYFKWILDREILTAASCIVEYYKITSD